MSQGGGGEAAYPGVIPAFQGDVNQMRNFANSLSGMTTPFGAFTPSPGMNSAAALGNNYFGAGGTGSLGIGQLNNILSGANLSPSSNPYLAQNITAMQQAFNQTLGSGMDKLNSQFTGLGQSPSSGPRQNASSQFARGAMSDFSNSLNNMMFGQYNQGQNQIMQALGMMDQPLASAGMASALGQAPGQQSIEEQQYGLNLASLPFQYLMQMMQAAPVGYPQYQQEGTPWYDYLLQGAGQGIGPGLAAAFA